VNGNRLGRLALAVLAAFWLGGCGASDGRSPEQLLTLSYSGLAAMDQYVFTGSTSMGMEGGVTFKPRTFEGKVVNHKPLTVQAEEQSAYGWSPIQTLEMLSKHNRGVTAVRPERGAATETVTLRTAADETEAKRLWEERLSQEMDAIAASLPQGSADAIDRWKSELDRSRKQLDAMLKTLKVDSQYEIVIDPDKLLPLKMDETTRFTYSRGGREVREIRQTSVRFGQFNGDAANPVQ